MDKKELRQLIRQRVSGISPSIREMSSKGVTSFVTSEPQWEQSKVVLLFNSLPDEIDCGYLIRDAVCSGKTVILPVVDGDTLSLVKYDPDHLVVGSFGIMEPDCSCEEVSPEDIDLAIIPARAYSMLGVRLGRGKGYYDRLLPQLACPKWGICYTCQLIPDLPSDKWDIPVDRVFF